MKMNEKAELLSGEKLYKYLHMSKRRVKWLLENGFLPYVDTGKATHRYFIKKCDAEDFKKKLEKYPMLLNNQEGSFSSKGNDINRNFVEEITDDKSRRFKRYLSELWKKEPDALPDRRAAELVGFSQQAIYRLCDQGKVYGVKVENKRYCSKESLITYFSSKEMMAKPNQSERYAGIVNDFMMR